ncbi:MAG: T9SS type A sorting domain-containing protein [Bacteroidia bacterium]|nr:T9SS type A sorting domain-containing protein [Bacteroidia bacterium]
MKIKLLLFTLLLASGLRLSAQNCGVLDSVSYTIVDNGNGTSNYTFVGYFSTTSGGSKSVDVSIYCGSYYFVTNDCVGTTTSQITKTYGPFNNVTTCTGTIFIDWIGYTNSVCGGSPCGGATGISPVPVSLMDFAVTKTKTNEVLLTWETASELNNDKFVIERKLNSEEEFMPIGEVSGMGTTNSISYYSYKDFTATAFQKVCYRLKQVDFDNAFEFSDVECMKQITNSTLVVFPNPANSVFTIASSFDGFEYEVMNAYGQIVVSGSTNSFRKSINSVDLSNGIYDIKVKSMYGIGMETVKLSITR